MRRASNSTGGGIRSVLPYILVVVFLIGGTALVIGGGWLWYDLYQVSKSPWASPTAQFCYPFVFKYFGLYRCVGALDFTEPWDVGWAMLLGGIIFILAGIFTLLLTLRVRRRI